MYSRERARRCDGVGCSLAGGEPGEEHPGRLVGGAGSAWGLLGIPEENRTGTRAVELVEAVQRECTLCCRPLQGCRPGDGTQGMSSRTQGRGKELRGRQHVETRLLHHMEGARP